MPDLDFSAKRLERVPMGRMGTVVAVVTAVHYRASDAAPAHLRESHSDHLAQVTAEHALIS